jgi:hypothetical protein
MAHHAPKTVRLHRRHFAQYILDQRPPNRRKGIAVVEAERRELVAASAKVK